MTLRLNSIEALLTKLIARREFPGIPANPESPLDALPAVIESVGLLTRQVGESKTSALLVDELFVILNSFYQLFGRDLTEWYDTVRPRQVVSWTSTVIGNNYTEEILVPCPSWFLRRVNPVTLELPLPGEGFGAIMAGQCEYTSTVIDVLTGELVINPFSYNIGRGGNEERVWITIKYVSPTSFNLGVQTIGSPSMAGAEFTIVMNHVGELQLAPVAGGTRVDREPPLIISRP